MTTADKITKAKINLILSQPFFATLMLSLKVIEDNTVKRAATDGESIKLNPQYIDGLSIDEVKGLLCSAVMKVANLHHLRRNGRDQNTWNKASELSVNPIIKNSGLKLPPQSLYDSQYKDLAAEQIFKLLPAPAPDEQPGTSPQQQPDPNGNQQGTGQGNQPGNNGAVEVQDGPQKTDGEKAEAEAKIKQKVAQAAMIGKKAGNMPGGLQEMINEILEPKVNWKEVLARFITDTARNDYSFKKPNPRFIQSGFYLPSLYNEEPGNIIFIVDTSGSIDEELFFQFAGELQDVSNEMRNSIKVIYVDTKVQGEQDIEPDEPIKLEIKGRGGTKFSPGFNYIEENNIEAKAIVYLTDGDADDYPENEPEAPTLWVVYNNKRFSPKFGEVIQID